MEQKHQVQYTIKRNNSGKPKYFKTSDGKTTPIDEKDVPPHILAGFDDLYQRYTDTNGDAVKHNKTAKKHLKRSISWSNYLYGTIAFLLAGLFFYLWMTHTIQLQLFGIDLSHYFFIVIASIAVIGLAYIFTKEIKNANVWLGGRSQLVKVGIILLFSSICAFLLFAAFFFWIFLLKNIM